MPPKSPFEVVAAHELDAAFVIAMWLWAHGFEGPLGQPEGGGPPEEQSELLARALSNHLGSASKGNADNVVERLGTLGIHVSVNVDNKQSNVKTTKEFHERLGPEELKKPHKICIHLKEWQHCRPILVTHLPKG
jgi:hypothetical protein